MSFASCPSCLLFGVGVIRDYHPLRIEWKKKRHTHTHTLTHNTQTHTHTHIYIDNIFAVTI